MRISLTFVLLAVAAYQLNDRIRFVTDIRPAPTVSLFATFMIIAGIAVGTLGLLRPGSTALALAALVFPVFMTFGTGDLWQLDAGVSARPAAQSAKDHLPSRELDIATTYELQRDLKFGLNFYLHREITEWSPPIGRSSIVFTTAKHSRELEQMGIRCFHYVANPAVEICVDSSTVPSLTDGLHDGGQPH